MDTLLKAVTQATGLSRRKAFAAIREGRVYLDGAPLSDPSAPYPGGILTLDGAPLQPLETRKTYLMLNKPPGLISSAADEQGRRTVLDAVPQALRVPGLHSVGRLDRDTSGLLLITNDGDLTYLLTHPRHEIEKEYWVRLRQPPDAALFDALRAGAEIDGQIRRPLRVSRLAGGQFEISVTIREGRNRQVRRLFQALDQSIVALRRVREGPLQLGSLPEGATRSLSQDEVEALRAAAQPSPGQT